MTTIHNLLSQRRVAQFAALAVFGLIAVAGLGVRELPAATITIVNNDGVGEGFNDPAPRAPVGGNPGVTLGAQRLFVFNHAASIWGSLLQSNVVILVRAQFNPQTCTPTSAVLGSAGPVTVHANFVNAPFVNHWYHQALANKLEGVDLSLAQPDINATFNLNLDSGTCLGGLVWYYGIDGLEGVNIELLPVVLHELGHGLGFSTTTSGTTGNYLSMLPSIYDHFLLDTVTGTHWDTNTPAQRVASAIAIDKLVWDGPGAALKAAGFLGPRPRLFVNSPPVIAGSYAAQAATFGAALTLGGLTGNLVLADDGAGLDVNDACEPLINAGAVAGNIALVNRGNCTFAAKAANVQAAGAIGMIVINNAAGLPPMGGTDPTITIPCIGITQADGATIVGQLMGGVNATIALDPSQLAGTDNMGRPLMYTPSPFQGGSSVSHWDTSMFPNALMEPAINNDLHDIVDLTHGHFVDIGWYPDAVPVALQEFAVEGRDDGVLLRWRFADPAEVGTIAVQRAPAAEGPWSPTPVELGSDGDVTLGLDTSAEPGRTYFYRLSVTDRSGEASVLGLASGSRRIESTLRLVLGAPKPNPATQATSFQYRVPAGQKVSLTVCDVSGRLVRTLKNGPVASGDHVQEWDGRTDRGSEAPAGVYFISLRTASGEVKTQRVAIVR